MPSWTKEQSEAINKEGTNIIVSAGAGSGKTAVLSERVLRKLKDGVNIDNLLILTFTKAAALEMKERIRKKISKEHSLKEQLDRIDNAYITTFDSYALSIVKKYNYLLNVNKNVGIIETSIIDLEKEKILNELFDEYYLKKEPKFLKLIDDFCSKDDKEIKEAILTINSKLDLMYEKELYLKNYINLFYNDEFINNKIEEYENLLLEKVSKISSLLLDLEEYVDEDYYEKINNTLSELLISDTYERIKENIVGLPNLPKNTEEEAKKIKEEISSLLKELTTLTIYQNKQEIKESIHKTKDYVEIFIEVILEFDKRINDYKYKKDLYEFNDIAKMAIKILEQNKDIAQEIKYSLNEILIDEYQDTNNLQDLFISYIENNNVYMVGDIKQSIYRFRNANPNLFKSKYDNYSKNQNGYKIDLNKNFRSREEVLNNINLIFDLIMDNKIGGAEYSESHRMIFGNMTYNEEGKLKETKDLEIYNYVYDKNSEYKKEEIEIFMIASDIKNKILNHYQVFDKDSLEVRDMKYSDIAILMDRSTHFMLYKKIFEYLNIPLTVYKDESITDSVDISIIKNLFNLFINNKYDESFKYSFISIMRSYLFNLNDDEIFDYFLNNNYQTSELMKIIKSIDISNLTSEELLLKIIDEFKFYQKMITVGDVEKHIVTLDYLIDIACNLTKMGYTINNFYEYLEELSNKNYEITYSAKLEENGVKIMTIHKSKGLEFHLCYYSGLYAKFNISDLKERFIFDNKYGMIVPFIDNGIRQTIYKDLLKKDYLIDEISERIRLFYVALTRAKEKMIIIAPISEEDSKVTDKVELDIRKKYTSFLDILNSIKNKISPFIKNIDLTKINLTKEYNFVKKENYHDKINKTEEKLNVNELQFDVNELEEHHFSKTTNKLYTTEEIKNMEFGKRIHSYLQNIDFKNPNYTGLSDFEKKKVTSFVENDILKNVIHMYKEYEFIYTVENIEYHGIIDLLLEYQDKYAIVDYKLKYIEDKEYINQLNGYKKYIEALTNKPVEIYLYSILDENLKKL